MVRLLNRYRTELGVEATSDELEATAKATVRQLQEQTATLSIARSELAGGKLNVDVEVQNLTGHKFPTRIPLAPHMAARDRARSPGTRGLRVGRGHQGRPDPGNDNDADATKYEPHYDQITSADEVQIYEPIMGDPNNVPTTGLLTATHYIKDNRLLPRGFDKTTADDDIGVYGAALQDANFTGDGDRVRYSMDVPAGGGTLPGGSRTAVSADRLPVGAQPREVRRAGAQALRRLLQRDVVSVVGGGGEDGGNRTIG